MKKKVAIIIERTNIALGGAERSIFELAAALSNLNIEVHTLAAKGNTETKNIHILCNKKPSKRTSYFAFVKALKKHLQQNSYDIIHSTLPFDFADIYQPRGGSFAEAVERNITSYQNRYTETYKKITAPLNFRRAILLRAEKKLCKKTDAPIITCLSQYVASQFKKHYNVNDERLAVIVNGIKTNKQIEAARADKLRSQILAKLKLKEADNPILFLFAANNFRLKGLSCLIKAMAVAKSQNANRKTYLVVAGNGGTAKYRYLARKLNIHKQIVFLGSLRHIQNVLAITNVAILPTFYDPCSRFILEALAANKPVITTKFNGAIDLFTDGKHGKIIDEPQNIPALAEAIKYFTNLDNIEKASEAIIEDNLKEKISINRAATQIDCLYEQILAKRRNK
ncbi:MAG: glycosyltransferase family 4 protein [Planctomycetes bacterium]|nr:glycosyltransferase family 4 protein [Planctomycetota bacterium]